MQQKTKSQVKKKKTTAENVEKILFDNREIFLFGEITLELAKGIVRRLVALEKLNSKIIKLRICSPGGSCSAGFSIIDTMQIISAPVHTIIHGETCSMASLISVTGAKRFATENAIWMQHPLSDWMNDYSSFIKDRLKSHELLMKQMRKIYKECTKLSQKELKFLERGELWFDAEGCLEKGIIDKIL